MHVNFHVQHVLKMSLNSEPPQRLPTTDQDCLSCRIIGTAALTTVGLYALRQSRIQAPGSVAGKRIVGALGICM